MTEKITSLAVWDVPMPVVAGGTFSIKIGATAEAGTKVEVDDASGKAVASGTLGDKPFAGTDTLVWTTLDVPSPAKAEVAEYTVRAGDASSRFSVVAAGKPEHMLTVQIKERDTSEALAGVEIRLGAFHARTDKSGHAEVLVCKGQYQLQLWRNGHIAPHQPIEIKGDMSVELTMVHVPEEHPDARWVR